MKKAYRAPTVGQRLAAKSEECRALREEIRLLTLALYRESQERHRLEERLLPLMDTPLEPRDA